MWTDTRVAAHLAVVGGALLVAAVHAAPAPVRAAPAATPAAVAAVPPATAAVPIPTVAVRGTVRVLPTTGAAVPRARRQPRAAVPFRTALAAAVKRIPTYRPGTARWVVSRAYAFWGTADWYHDVLYVSPDVPRDKLYDVAVHEWSHELSVLDYDGDVAAAKRAMNAWFGGSGLGGAERAADCMAIRQGATWTHYTTCTNAHWRAGAARLAAGRRL